jgi:hypothetical protein
MSRRTTAKEKITRTPIDEAKFVKVWARVHLEGGSLQDVADEIGCSYAGAKNKADKMVEDGVKLPELKRGRGPKQRDVKALNEALKAELAKK